MKRRGPGRPPGSPGQQGRDAILKSARELLAAQGTARVTLKDVAERAGVRAPLVHYYFGSKAELFEAVIEEVVSSLRERLESIAEQEGTPADRLRSFVKGLVHGMAENPFTPRLMAELIIFPDDERTDRFMRDFGAPNAAVLIGLAEEGVRSGDFADVDPRTFVPSVLGMCIFYFLGAPGLRRMLDFEPLDPERVEQYADTVADLVVRGLAARSDA